MHTKAKNWGTKMSKFTYNEVVSDGVLRENKANIEISVGHSNFLLNCSTPKEFYSRIGGAYSEYCTRFDAMKPGKKILDVGVGRGDSSVFLAELGHNVHSVEPSPDLCEIICAAAGKFKLSITVHQTVGEYINNIEEDDFDIVCFNASLHHCDDPLLALRNCYQKLRPGGRIYLLNETILKPYRSEKGYQLLLQKYPEKMGHYGGNEHAYHVGKYKSLVKQVGFKNLAVTSATIETDTLLSIEHKVSRKFPDGTRVWSPMKAFVAINWFFIRTLLLKLPIFSKLILHSSMVQVQFEAKKPE